MVQRAIKLQVCCVCNRRFKNSDALDAHTEDFHGVHWHPAVLTRAEDQMEFKGKPRKAPSIHHIPWPVGFGE